MAIKALNPFSSMDDSLKEKVKTKLHFNNIGEYEQSIISVYYDAWENDNEVKPIISIIYEIANN